MRTSLESYAYFNLIFVLALIFMGLISALIHLMKNRKYFHKLVYTLCYVILAFLLMASSMIIGCYLINTFEVIKILLKQKSLVYLIMFVLTPIFFGTLYTSQEKHFKHMEDRENKRDFK